MLRNRAREGGLDVVLTREPGGTPVGERIRSILLGAGPLGAGPADIYPRTDALLFNAARAQLVGEVIRPALQRGALVISTRFADSTLAYQGYGAGLPLAELRAVERLATGGLRPDLTILLDLPAEVGLARKTGGEITRFESELDVRFHRRVRDGFLELAARERDRFAVVDAAQSPDRVAEAVLAAASRLPGLEALAERPVGGPEPGAHERGGRAPASEPQPAAERIHR